jgi:hypothetical protein
LTQTSRERNETLGALVGRWHTQDWTRVDGGIPSDRIDAYDLDRGALRHTYFGTDGRTAFEDLLI